MPARPREQISPSSSQNFVEIKEIEMQTFFYGPSISISLVREVLPLTILIFEGGTSK